HGGKVGCPWLLLHLGWIGAEGAAEAERGTRWCPVALTGECPMCIAVLVALLVAAEPERVRLSDDFTTDTRKEYEIQGDIRWQKGQLTLGPGAQLTRKVALGSTGQVRASLRLPAGREAHEVRLGFQTD